MRACEPGAPYTVAAARFELRPAPIGGSNGQRTRIVGPFREPSYDSCIVSSPLKPAKNGKKAMNNKFDQLAKGVAKSVTRRQALRRFGFGLVAMALAGFGFNARAACLPSGTPCDPDGGAEQHRNCNDCCGGVPTCSQDKEGRLHCVCL